MDRDKRWERTAKAYNLIVNGKGKQTQNPTEAIQESYDQGVTDEFIKPIVLTDENGDPVAKVKENDVVIFFNFRTDRGRQLTQALSQENFPKQEMKKLPLYFVTMTNYDREFQNIKVVFQKENLKATLGETLEYMGKSQLRAAETEKYPHVTFFFSGGREKPFKDEERILVNSPKVATYDLQPEMSAPELTEKLVNAIKNNKTDFFCINFANPDMVGHTGNFDAAVKAVETVDQSLQKIMDAAGENYSSIVLADHGNCEKLRNDDGSPNTAHTTNPVPVILVDKKKREIKDGILGNIAPTILDLMELKHPELMTQKSLLK
jgi:2,3-bisphosphoglycerate-independent phosphoglycerate mutase